MSPKKNANSPKYDNNTHTEHRKRMREHCIKSGIEHFPDHNKLEVLLYYSIPRKDTNPIAHRLIEHFGSLSGVFDAPLDELCKVEDIGEYSALLIKLMPQLFAAYCEDQNKNITVIDTVDKAGEYLKPKFIGKTQEFLYIVTLDPQKRVISCRKVAEGTPNTLSISLRKIAEICLQCNATFVIIAHNHPRGALLPSKEDCISSGKITLTLKMLNIEVADHMIFSGTNYMTLGTCLEYVGDNIY